MSAAVVVSAIAVIPRANATTQFNGSWSVLVTTKTGPCNKSYRFRGEITNGIITYAGSAQHDFYGRVAPNGVVTVKVSVGPATGAATGRLSGNTGTGTWHGKGPDGPCAGTWDATRH